jgi:hypothetical protein
MSRISGQADVALGASGNPAGSAGGGSAEMISDLLCTTTAPTVLHGLRLPLKPHVMSAEHFNGSWRPLSTDPAIEVPALVTRAMRSR